MMVVRDVTSAAVASSSISKQSNKLQTTITPFQKVLEQEETKAAANSTTVTDTSSDNKTSTSASSSVTSAGAASESGAVQKTDSSSSSDATTLKDIFKRASEKYDISYDFLLAVAKAESDFDTNCVSSAGARGIMQLMPDECKEFGVTDPFNEEQNIMASAKLLAAHLKKFNGDFTLAAAAYNAGSGAVKKYGGVPPYTETQNYVKKIAKFMAEGVKVPDRVVSTADSGGGGSTGKATSSSEKVSTEKSSASEKTFDTGKKATESDLAEVLVSVGSGSDKVTMTYGAYLKYLELGTTGVG